ncbi:MAG TPA: OmpH family outer membrane protein [Pyrinomonadaceae bacterium]|jgi:Skp family chaperone for outer membrane proteins
MKAQLVFAAISFILCAASLSYAQCPVAVIDSKTFVHPQNGIIVLEQAVSRLKHDLQPRRTQLQQLRERYQSIINEINKATQINGANIGWLRQKVDEVEGLEAELERLSGEYEEAYNRQIEAIVEPHRKAIAEVLQSIAKKRGYLVVLDRSKMKDAIIYVAKECDVTNELINQYNRRTANRALSNK